MRSLDRLWRIVFFCGLAALLMSVGVYFITLNNGQSASADSQTNTSSSTNDDCVIDQFILDHIGLEHCVGDPISNLLIPEEEMPDSAGGGRAGVAGTDPFGNPRGNFVNWEHPHVHPLDITPNGSRLLAVNTACLLYTSPSPRDLSTSRMPSSA